MGAPWTDSETDADRKMDAERLGDMDCETTDTVWDCKTAVEMTDADGSTGCKTAIDCVAELVETIEELEMAASDTACGTRDWTDEDSKTDASCEMAVGCTTATGSTCNSEADVDKSKSGVKCETDTGCACKIGDIAREIGRGAGWCSGDGKGT